MAFDLAGTEILGYVLTELIGEGGMASVWKGVSHGLRKTVAVKVLDPMLARDPGVAERFRREAELMHRLRHPHIVAAENLSLSPLAIVMEYVEGRSLEQVIGREVGPIPFERALPLMRQILSAVAYAHGEQVVHRDLKPSNILLTRDGVAKVMDFGIAKVVQDSSGMTRTGTGMGTAAYMSPEQIRGAKRVDERADIYSLGVTFYEMLAGRTPFEGGEEDQSDFAIRLAHMQEEPPDPRCFYPAIPEAAVRVVLRAMAKSPEDRFPSAEAFAEALEAAVEAVPSSGAAPTTGLLTASLSPAAEVPLAQASHGALSSRRRWLLFGLLAGVAMVGGVLAAFLGSGGESEPLPAAASVPTPAPAPAPEPSPVSVAKPAPVPPPAQPPAGAASAGRAGVEWVGLPGGAFEMGSPAGSSDERPVHRVTLSPFELARTEVTVRQYRECVEAGACTAPDTGGFCHWGKPARDDHPVNCVDWHQASSFCGWVGGRLPTEAEWEYAARSGGLARAYPWGNAEATCDYAVMNEGGGGCGRESTWPVCSRPLGHSAQGLCDLSGNVWEWVSDRYGDYASSEQRDPEGPGTGSKRVLRGGSWLFDAGGLRASDRARRVPGARSDSLGFRPARRSP